jgi:hypothetical protein
MQLIKNKSGDTIGIVNHQIILTPNLSPIGIILGRCVFSSKHWVGKIINQKIYANNGKIIGDLLFPETTELINFSTIKPDIWPLIKSIENHRCDWIDISDHWIDNDEWMEMFGGR